jgi:phage/plasmid primase-like uncharacterized protein
MGKQILVCMVKRHERQAEPLQGFQRPIFDGNAPCAHSATEHDGIGSGAASPTPCKGRSTEERAQLLAELATKKAEREQERRTTQNEAAQRAQAKAGELLPVESPTPYLAAKGITAHAGILTDHAGKIYIPAYDVDGKQWTMQTISEDGQKRFEKGGRKEGCFHVVGGQEKLKEADVIMISEGYATAASVSEATGRPVVAAFDAGNLKAVALALRERYPEKPILICGDDDRHQEKNPGRVKAEAAALAVNGKAVFPTFAPEENTRAFTDFNDLNKSALGKAAISRQVEPVIQAVKEHQMYVEEQTSAEDAKTQAERDLENIDTPGHDGQPPTPDERQRRIDDVIINSNRNQHYRETVEELSPGLLRSTQQHGTPEDAAIPDSGRDVGLERRARSEADVLESPEDTRSELLHIDDLDGRGREFNYQPGRVELEELRSRTPGATPEDTRSEILEAGGRGNKGGG